MKFDPEFNYTLIDIDNDENVAYYRFGELIKNLVTLSSDADHQLDIIGLGAAADEMALDFDTYFSISYQAYIKFDLLTAPMVDKLKELDEFFDVRSVGHSPDFWEDALLATHPDWISVRQMALEILSALNMDDLELKFDRTETNSTKKGELSFGSQTTKIWLQRKK